MSLFGGEFPPLRPFQAEAHEAIRQAARERHKRILVMAPTGAGKSILALNVIREALAKGKRAMFVCDRLTLIGQTSNVARELGLGHHGIIQAGNPMMDLKRPFQIASCQTLMRRGWPETDVLVIDECHSLYKTWVDYAMSPDCKAVVVGLSATPFSKGLGKVFTKLINAATMADLTERGTLVPMRIFSCRRPDMAGAETSGGEWTDAAAAKAEMVLVGDVVAEWSRLASDRKTIIFGPTILYCEALAKRFRDAGIEAATFTADTPDDERARTLQGFTHGGIRVLISVEALAKGFDQKDVGCICDCRPLRKSLSTAIQMWGRGLRSSPETGKKDCLLLDFSGNIIRFAEDFERVFHNGLDKLDDGERLDRTIREDDDKPPKACPKCGHTPFAKHCTGCGFEAVPVALTEERPGVMQEVRLGKRVLAPDHADLWAQVATYARRHSAPEKQQGRAAHLYRDIVGQWPPRDWRVDSTPWVEPTPATAGKIRSMAIAFARRRAA
jgi:superfamily II DNA or RNA helicase